MKARKAWIVYTVIALGILVGCLLFFRSETSSTERSPDTTSTSAPTASVSGEDYWTDERRRGADGAIMPTVRP